MAALFYTRAVGDGWSENPEADTRRGTDLARRAMQVAGDDPVIIANAANALACFGEDVGTMAALVDHALALNPSFARGWYINGCLRLWAGQPDIAIQHAEASLRLSPRARVGAVRTVIGAAHLLSRRFEEAVPELLLAIEETPNFPTPYRHLAACYAHVGRLDDARDVIKRLRALTSAVMPPIMYLRNGEHRQLVLSGLAMAAGDAE